MKQLKHEINVIKKNRENKRVYVFVLLQIDKTLDNYRFQTCQQTCKRKFGIKSSKDLKKKRVSVICFNLCLYFCRKLQ